MIYKNDVLVDWRNPKNEIEKEVREQIIAIQNKYFSDKGVGYVNLLYPKGAQKEKDNGWTQIKKFQIPLKSFDGQWRYTQSVRSMSRKNNNGYADHHKPVINETKLTKKDIELIWFLKFKSAVMNRHLFFEDLEEDARKEIDAESRSLHVEYMIKSPYSPISKDENMLRELAHAFGVQDSEKIGLYQLKKELYDTVVEGEQYGDGFVNFENFDNLVNGEKARKAAFIARKAIYDNVVGYKSNAWWLMSGRNYEEKLVTVPAGQANDREQVFVQAVVEDGSVRSRLFNAVGEEEDLTLDDLRELDLNSLRQRVKGFTGEFPKKGKKEELIAELCKEYDLKYTPLTV